MPACRFVREASPKRVCNVSLVARCKLRAVIEWKQWWQASWLSRLAACAGVSVRVIRITFESDSNHERLKDGPVRLWLTKLMKCVKNHTRVDMRSWIALIWQIFSRRVSYCDCWIQVAVKKTEDKRLRSGRTGDSWGHNRKRFLCLNSNPGSSQICLRILINSMEAKFLYRIFFYN